MTKLKATLFGLIALLILVACEEKTIHPYQYDQLYVDSFIINGDLKLEGDMSRLYKQAKDAPNMLPTSLTDSLYNSPSEIAVWIQDRSFETIEVKTENRHTIDKTSDSDGVTVITVTVYSEDKTHEIFYNFKIGKMQNPKISDTEDAGDAS